jgi:hypothetical protein
MATIPLSSARVRIVALATTLALSAFSPFGFVAAQGAAPKGGTARAEAAPTQPLDASARREVVESIGALLNRHYVDADTGARIARHLASRLSSGAYDAATDPYRFAELLTTDLRAVNGDGHLSVGYDPRRTAMRVGPEGLRLLDPPGAGGLPSPSPAMLASARRSHFNLGRADVLPGNVGYLEVRGFSGAPEARDAIIAALDYLRYADAMIIDLRRNGGGSAELVNFLISHFTGSDTLASLRVTNRSGGEDFTRYTLAKVPGPRRPDVPLFVLTSPATASAGEDFAFVLKNLGRAVVIGEPTAGAGHNNALLDAGHGFATSISFTRVMDPRTGAEWERIGVQPTIRVDQEKALEVAQAAALKEIEAKVSDPLQRQMIAAIRETLDAQANPKTVSESELASYAGEYEGGRRVTLRGGLLLFSPRPGLPADPLVPLGDRRFAVGATRLRFEGGGAATKLTITRLEGGSLTYARVK